jgi:hypothetical protein
MVAVAAAAVLLYLNSLGNGFAYDDLHLIVGNPLIQDPENLGTLWLAPYWPTLDGLERGLYRPLTSFLFAVQWAAGGGEPLLFHLTSVFLHALASVLVFALLEELIGRGPALAGALIFAAHPVHVEAVANPVGQAELLAAVLVLSAAVAYARRPLTGGSSPRLLCFLALAFLGGLLAKENAVVLPGLLVVLDVAQGRPRRKGYGSEGLRLGVLLLAVAAIYLTLRYAVLGGALTQGVATNLGFLLDPATRILTALSVWPEYARLLFAPADLSAMYDPATINPAATFTAPAVAGALLLLGAIATCLIPRAWPGGALGASWFLLSVLPVSNLLFPVGTVLAERTLYLPSVAVAIWAAYAFRWIRDRASSRRWPRAVTSVTVAAAVAGLGARAVSRNPVWSDNETLVAVTLRDHPENFRAQWFTASQLFEAGDTTGSREHWEEAHRTFSGHAGFLTSYARFLLASGATTGAEEMARQALAIDPNGAWSLFTMGLVETADGRSTLAASRAERLEALGFDELARALQDSIAAGGGTRR